MLESISLHDPMGLVALDDFLASDRAPLACMLLSELDGFLAGIAAGPEAIPIDEWLPSIWHEAEPEFTDQAEAEAALGGIMRRYNEIIGLLDMEPECYRPIVVDCEDGSIDASDWTLGFMQAMLLRENAWAPLVRDRDACAMLAPIMLIASTTDKADLPLGEADWLPEAAMAELLAEADTMLALSVIGIRTFFQLRSLHAPRRRTGRKAARSRKAKRQ